MKDFSRGLLVSWQKPEWIPVNTTRTDRMTSGDRSISFILAPASSVWMLCFILFMFWGCLPRVGSEQLCPKPVVEIPLHEVHAPVRTGAGGPSGASASPDMPLS